MNLSEKITKGFFWFAFSAFLAMSIPHVAYIFRFYEPGHDGFDTAWWAVSYGVAVGIDLLICWLSYTRSEQQNESRIDSIITWLFIVLLALLSWYCNWLFAELMTGIPVWSFVLPLGWTVGSITPIIVSAIPVFMIAYTYMSKRILGAKNAETLEQKAQRLEHEKALKERIKTAKQGQGLIAIFTGKAKELQQAKREIFAQNGAENGQNIPIKIERTSGELDPEVLENISELLPKDEGTFEQKTDEQPIDITLPIQLEKTLAFIENHPEYAGNWDDEKEQELATWLGLNRPASAHFWLLKAEVYLEETSRKIVTTNPELLAMPQEENHRRHVMTFEEASEYTGYTVQYLKGLVSRGEIQQSKAGKLLVSTLKIKGGATGKIPAIR